VACVAVPRCSAHAALRFVRVSMHMTTVGMPSVSSSLTFVWSSARLPHSDAEVLRQRRSELLYYLIRSPVFDRATRYAHRAHSCDLALIPPLWPAPFCMASCTLSAKSYDSCAASQVLPLSTHKHTRMHTLAKPLLLLIVSPARNESAQTRWPTCSRITRAPFSTPGRPHDSLISNVHAHALTHHHNITHTIT
jgi:hypothetical protein